MIIDNLLSLLKKKHEWIYGTCKGSIARKHRKKGNIQFVLWKKGDQSHIDGIGHTEDKWVDFDSSWWCQFVPNEG